MTPLEAFNQLYDNWPMQPEYRERAWQTMKSAVLVAQTNNNARDEICPKASCVPPTWLCLDCFNQWVSAVEAGKLSPVA